jgi:hypothetical protein
MSKNSLIKRTIISLFPLFIGGLIYLIFRVQTLNMFSWFDKIGATNFVNSLRSKEVFNSIEIPNWVKYNLPDALWVFSFTYLMLTIWKFKINKSSVFWIFLAPIIGILSEVGQLLGFVSGTFDGKDLFFLIIAMLLPFSSIIYINLNQINHEQISNN